MKETLDNRRTFFQRQKENFHLQKGFLFFLREKLLIFARQWEREVTVSVTLNIN